MARLRLTLVGVGAMRSPRYAPAGLLVETAGARVLLDGARPPRGRLDAWLVTDEKGELIAAQRRRGRARGIEPRVARFSAGAIDVRPRRVAHTSHPAYAYRIACGSLVVVWAPEFWRFPRWAARADLLFAEAAGWSRPIRFAGGVGGHMAALDVSRAARRAGVRRLVFAHLGRPTLRAIDAGERPPFGELAREGLRFSFLCGQTARTSPEMPGTRPRRRGRP